MYVIITGKVAIAIKKSKNYYRKKDVEDDEERKQEIYNPKDIGEIVA